MSSLTVISIPSLGVIDLLTSKAKCLRRPGRECAIYPEMDCSKFEEAEEHFQNGCGKIPCCMMTDLLGSRAIGQRAFAAQIWAFVPRRGMFKGSVCFCVSCPVPV